MWKERYKYQDRKKDLRGRKLLKFEGFTNKKNVWLKKEEDIFGIKLKIKLKNKKENFGGVQIFLTLIEMNWPLPFIRATQTLVFSPKDKSFVHKDTINALSLVPGYYILNRFFFY